MKKKATNRSAFSNPRTLFGFVLCLLGAVLAFVAFSGLTGQSVSAQGNLSRTDRDKLAPNDSAPAPKIANGVRAIATLPLRDLVAISPTKAPGHDHPEPMRPAPPFEGAGPDTVLQTNAGPVLSAPTATGLSWDAVGVGLAGFAPSSNPPDVNGRVGGTQYVQWNNTSFAVFDKSTGALLYGPAAGNTLFQSLGGVCATHNDGDPVVSYDILAGRWILSQFAVDGPAGSASHQCVAVSQTGDATGAYYLYDFLTDGTNFVDYPHTGVWPDGYYMTAHVFNAAGTAVVAARVYVFEREKMLTGQAARMQSANLAKFGTRFQFGFLPADLDSLTPPAVGEASFVLGPHPATLTLTASTRVAVTWGATPTIALTETTITNTTYNNAPCVTNSNGRDCVPQPAPALATDYLDNISAHFMYRLAYRNNGTQAAPQESLVANITVRGATTTPQHGAIRWYEFRNAGSSTTAPTIFQQSTYDPETTSYRWLGSIAMDKDQNIALGYSRSSTSIKPSIYLTGRLATDPVNTMGAETSMTNGTGSQTSGGGNRWGDYSAMTLDPVDQCTFYYTNEYLKADGIFNWSTRVAAFRFPSCTDAAVFGTLVGTITSSETGAPIPGVTVTLNNGYAGATNAAGVYSILTPAGTYTAVAADAARNCTTAVPASPPVIVAVGSTSNQDFIMSGASKLEANGFTVDDSAPGNNNAIVNKDECVRIKAKIKNNGCAVEKAIAATLTTSTPGVTVINGSSNYPNLAIDASAENTTPFTVSTSSSFVCGTNIALTLNLTSAGGNKTIQLNVPTCTGGPNQTIPPSAITPTDPVQTDRLGRDGVPSTCAGKASPGGIGGTPGARNYKTFNFTNSGGAPACFTVTINAATGVAGTGDIESAAYLNAYDPTQLDLNYLGDSGISGLGTTVGTASYSFVVPASSNFVVVVNTATANTISSTFSGTVSGFFDQTSGPGACVVPTPSLAITGASSRVTHTGAGPFDINLPLSGPATGIESRSNGSGNYAVVFSFDNAVNAGTASVVSSNGGGGSLGSVAFNGNEMIVNLTGVTDQQTLTVTANNVTGVNGAIVPSASVKVGYLIGDVNGNGMVTNADVSAVKNLVSSIVDSSSFLADVNANGFITNADVSAVKNHVSNSLPPNTSLQSKR